MEPLRRLSSLNEHRSLLREVFQTARERVLIVSPFVSKSALHADGIPARVQSAISRGVVVQVYIDNDLNRVDGGLKRSANDGIAELLRAGATVIVLDGIHNKTLIRDNDLITEGSFNWLSAVRTAGGTHQREERTIVVEGAEARQMIEDEIKGLRSKKGGVARIRSIVPENIPVLPMTVPHPKKTARMLTWIRNLSWILYIGFILLCVTGTGPKLPMDIPEFFMVFVFFIIFVGFISWKLSGDKKIFRIAEPDEVKHHRYTSSDLADQLYAGNINNQSYKPVVNPECNPEFRFNSFKLDD